MYNICIYGGNGKIGTGTARCLSILGYNIDSFDISGTNQYARNMFYNVEPENIHKHGQYDAIVNCGPYELSSRVRKAAYDMQIKYIDFGGSSDVEEEIRNDIDGCKYGVLTGVGIAPGYMNLMASSAVKFIKEGGGIPKRLFMYVGGITLNSSDNFLGWVPTWSVEGLIKSYTGKSKIITNGNIEEVEPFDRYGTLQYSPKHIDTENPENNIFYTLEAFANSGGMSHTLYEMLDQGLRECAYYTLRWPGHAHKIQAMIKMKEKFFISNKKFCEYIHEICNTKSIDIVLSTMYLYYQDKNKPEGQESLDLCKLYHIPHDNMSAMQMATCVHGAGMIDFVVKENLTDFITYKELDYYEVTDTCCIIYKGLGLPDITGTSQYMAHMNKEQL